MAEKIRIRMEAYDHELLDQSAQTIVDRAQATGIRSLQNFVERLRRDVLAVEAAVITRWSNGPVEGHVNRLKTIKRQMYGRAGVELLRARLIPLSP